MFLKYFCKVSVIFLILTVYTFAQEEYKKGELLVNFNNQGKDITLTDSKSTQTTGISSIDKLNVKYDCYKMERVYLGPAPPAQGLYLLKFPEESDMLKISADYQKDSSVETAEFNYILQVTNTPNDYYFSQQWNHDSAHLQSELAWNLHTGASDVIISINDTGIDYLHPDLQNNIWVNPGEDLDGDGVVGDFGTPGSGGDENGIDDDGNGYVDDLIGWDFYFNDNNPQHSSSRSHGTKVAGMSAATGNNSVGVAGVSWNSKLMATKVGHDQSIWGAKAISAIYYSADNGADVINFSWRGNGTIYSTLKTALDYAHDTYGLTLVAAAGNDSDSLRNYPAEYSKVIAVAALYENDTKRWNSCWGSWIDVSAPGHLLWTTDYLSGSHTYSYGGATSIASPQIAGLAALIKSVNPTYENWEIEDIIINTTDNIDVVNPSYAGLLGSGRINAYEAVYLSTKPQNLSVMSHHSHPLLFWESKSNQNIDGYYVYRKENSGPWVQIAYTVSNSYIDEIVDTSNPHDTFYYKVRAKYASNELSIDSDIVTIDGLMPKRPADGEISISNIPVEFSLRQNFPNPFNPSTIISFDLPSAGFVSLVVYNLTGQKIATLCDGFKEAGSYSLAFDGRDLSSGIYIYKITAGQETSFKRMLLVK